MLDVSLGCASSANHDYPTLVSFGLYHCRTVVLKIMQAVAGSRRQSINGWRTHLHTTPSIAKPKGRVQTQHKALPSSLPQQQGKTELFRKFVSSDMQLALATSTSLLVAFWQHRNPSPCSKLTVCCSKLGRWSLAVVLPLAASTPEGKRYTIKHVQSGH